jgi:hypothetical protein
MHIMHVVVYLVEKVIKIFHEEHDMIMFIVFTQDYPYYAQMINFMLQVHKLAFVHAQNSSLGPNYLYGFQEQQ